MAPNRDFAGLAHRAAAVLLPNIAEELYPDGRREGSEWCAVGSNGHRSLKINLRSGKWKDWSDAASRGGDLLALWARRYSLSMGAAAVELETKLGIGTPATAQPRKNGKDPSRTKKRLKKWIQPAPVEPPDDPGAWKSLAMSGPPERRFRVNDARGQLLYEICRWPRKDRKAMPRVYGEMEFEDGHTALGWWWNHPPDPRPLYGLDRLAAALELPVIVYEGEKKADAGTLLLDGYVHVSWSGGHASWPRTDWLPLTGRPVLLWGDADEVGDQAVHGYVHRSQDGRREEFRTGLGHVLQGLGCKLYYVDTAGMPESWDIANAIEDGWSSDRIRAWLNERVREWKDRRGGPAVEEEPPAPEPDGNPIDGPPREDDTHPLQPLPLGHDRGLYYFLDRVTKEVRSKTAPELNSTAHLMDMAPWDRYWQTSTFFGEGRRGRAFDVQGAANAMITLCKARGKFNPKRIRGRGVWSDDGRWIVHLGDKLIVDDVPMKIDAIKSNFIYEGGETIDIDIKNPLSDVEAARYIEVCQALTFQKSWHALALAGWTAAGLICGALPWRPHLMIDGPAGSGKGSVMSRYIKPLLGAMQLAVGSNTSEAAIRRELGTDALVVIFDEAESEDRKARERVQEVLDLARQASDDSSPPISKAGLRGRVDHFLIRSMFCLAAINSALSRQADESRFLILGKTKHPDVKSWSGMRAAAAELLTPEYSARMLARMVRMIPIVVGNMGVLSDAIAEHSGSRRVGDTLGTIYAGVEALRHQRALGPTEAMDTLVRSGWIEEAAHEAVEQENDMRALNHLLEHRQRVEAADRRPHDMTVSELIRIVRDNQSADGVYPEDAKRVLSNIGIVLLGEHVWFVKGHSQLALLFQRTPWERSHGRVLAQVPGATDTGGAIRFGNMGRRNATGIPISTCLDEDAPAQAAAAE